MAPTTILLRNYLGIRNSSPVLSLEAFRNAEERMDHPQPSYTAIPQLVFRMPTPYLHDSAAQPGIAADRFARKIVGFWKALPGALAAAECQTVGPPLTPYRFKCYTHIRAVCPSEKAHRMSAAWYIVPFLPPDWAEHSSSFQIDATDFRARLRQHWGDDITFTQHSTMPDVEWIFRLPDGYPSLDWALYHHRQVVRCRHDDYTVDFICWYRIYVPAAQRLFLLSASSGQYLELTTTMTSKAILTFFRAS